MLRDLSNTIRGLSADMVEKANSGHPGLPLGCSEIGAILYGRTLKINPKKPNWINRDRFVLSAGHGSALLYSCLHLLGFELSLEELKNFRQLNSMTPGHPEFSDTPGVDATTGPLGQGFSNAVGMALSERVLASKYNKDNFNIIDHYTYTLLGDGCMMEGISSEAASLAGHLGLNKLIAIYDDNSISIEGSTELAFTESVAKRFESYNWNVIDDIDGNDISSIERAIESAKESETKPSLIIAKTKIGFGSPNKEGKASSHGAPLGKEEIKSMKEKFSLPTDKEFYVSDTLKDSLKERQSELIKEYERWEIDFNNWKDNYPDQAKELENGLNLSFDEDLRDKLYSLKLDDNLATRKLSGEVLSKIADEIPYLIGGSADLAPSTLTYLKNYKEIQKDNFDGRNIRFGVREQAMAGISNGISLHGGLRPFCSTFLVFSDYMKSGIRMSALMKQPIIYIFTHDSIYVGEDGPTHQPIEHIESLRLIPNLKVIRPADEDEVKEAWLSALNNLSGPTALILTRQGLPALRKDKNLFEFNRGGYILSEEKNEHEITIMASGSEVSLALETAKLLEEKNIGTRVVSVPDKTRFINQSESYKNQVLGSSNIKRVAIEVGVGIGWTPLVQGGKIFDINRFGLSGPGGDVAKEFGFYAEYIMKNI